MLKIFAGGLIFLFIVLTVERCCGLQMVGSCTFQVYIEKARQCTTAFITELQSDPSVDCKGIYSRMVECTKDYVRECVKDHVADNKIEAFLNEAAKQLKSEDFYCKDGLFSAPVLTDERKKEIPCNETFYDESQDCGNTFQTKFRSNRADETLCKEFADAKVCLKEAVDEHCHFDKDAAEILQSAFDDYNPFCNVSSNEEEKEPSEEGYYLPDDQSNEEVLDAIGRCSVIAQLNRTRQCITLFVRSLQADPQGNCSVKYVNMQDCIVCMLRSCLEKYGIIADADIEIQVEQSLNQTQPEDFYCQGMLEAPKASSSHDHDHLECDPGFQEEEVKCLKEFDEAFQANVSDPSLCSKFTQSKRCLRDLITTSCSNGSRTSSLEFALVFDDFNPFCQGSVDQQADDASSPSPEEFSDPCLAEFPTPSLLRSAASASSQSLCLSFLIIIYFIVTLRHLFQEEKK